MYSKNFLISPLVSINIMEKKDLENLFPHILVGVSASRIEGAFIPFNECHYL